MKVILYKSSAESNRLDKSSYLEKIAELDGYLREASSIISPVIQFELPNQSQSLIIDEDDEELETPDSEIVIDSTLFYSFNYAFIEDFNRFYFVQDVTIVRSNLFRVQFIIDVLMTHRDNLLSLPALVERNEYDFDDLLADDSIPLKLNKEVREITNLRGSLTNWEFDPNLPNESYSITLTITGLLGSYEIIEAPSNSGLPDINSYNMASSSTTYVIRESDYAFVMNGLMDQQSAYASYILSVVAYPFRVETETTNKLDITFGSENGTPRTIPDPDGNPIKGRIAHSFSKYMVIADFEVPLPETFLDAEPFSQYELYIPFYGWFKLDYDLVKGHRILLYYAVNRDDGSATAYVWDYTDKRPVFSTPCQLGVKLALSNTNQQELSAQKNALGLNLAVGLISSAVSIGMGVATKNPMAIAGGVLSIPRAITSAVNAYSMMFPRASATFGDSATGMYSPMQARLRITSNARNIPDANMSEFRKLCGAPLRDTRILSTLRGFTIVSDIHLENLIAFKREKEEIERLLKTGVIL